MWYAAGGRLANLGRSRPCKGAAFRLQMQRAGGGESYGGHLLTLSASTLGSEEGVRAPEPQPRGSTHVNSTHSPRMSLILGLDTSAVHFL